MAQATTDTVTFDKAAILSMLADVERSMLLQEHGPAREALRPVLERLQDADQSMAKAYQRLHAPVTVTLKDGSDATLTPGHWYRVRYTARGGLGKQQTVTGEFTYKSAFGSYLNFSLKPNKYGHRAPRSLWPNDWTSVEEVEAPEGAA